MKLYNNIFPLQQYKKNCIKRFCIVLICGFFLLFITNQIYSQNGQISGSVWNDCNGNGIQDLGDQALNMNVQVGLMNEFGAVIATQITDASGNYSFSNLPSGNYQIVFGLLPNPYRLTLQNIGGDDITDSDPDRITGIVEGIVLLSDEIKSNINAGYFEQISISGFVFNDIFEDGIKNGDDQGKLSVQVELVMGCPDGEVIGNATTDVNGMYTFNNVPPGQITIRVIVSPDLALLVPTTGLSYCLDIGCAFSPNIYDFGFAFNCNNPTTPSFPSCEAIDYVMCNLKVEMDGFCAEMPNFLTQPAPGNGCFVPHNMTWFAFTAGFGDYRIVVTPINCVPGLEPNLGVQTGIYSDCTFSNLIVCNGEPNTDKVELSSSNLIPGNTYYFFTDGFNRSQCNITLSIEGDFTPFEYDDPQEIEISGACDYNIFNDICVNNEITLRVNPYIGIEELEYHWIIQGDNGYMEELTLKRNNEIIRTFANPGEYTICVTVSNFCQTKDPICKVIQILEKKADADQGLFNVCRESFPYNPNTPDVNGKVYMDEYGNQWQGGQIEFFDADGTEIRHFYQHCGCDYYQIIRVQEIFSESGSFDVALCPDEIPFMYDNFSITENIYGNKIILSNSTTASGCDSTVFINARILDMKGDIQVIACQGNEVTLKFFINDSIQFNNDYDGIEYGWLHNNTVIGNDPILKTTRKGLFTLRITIYKFDKECIHEFTYFVDPANLAASEPTLKGSDYICLDNKEDIFYISNPTAGHNYEWTYPDTFKQVRYSLNNDSLFINWNADTIANICVRANNGCGWSNFTCQSIKTKKTNQPTLFIADSTCVNANTIIYTNSTDSLFIWSISGDTMYSGKQTKKDTLDIQWDTAGKKFISLLSINDGCPSPVTVDSIQVFLPASPPVLNCTSTNNSITFNWTDPADALGYNFNVSDGFSGIHSFGSTYTITDLPADKTIGLDIEVISFNPCGNYNIPQKSCTTQNCIPPLVTIVSPISEICLNVNSGLIPISANIFPMTNGTGIFSGLGVNTSDNTFDPVQAGVGVHTISYDFIASTDNCKANSSITIQVKPPPSSNFTVSQNAICIDSVLSVKYTGIPQDAMVQWILPDDAIGTPSNNNLPFGLKWNYHGNYTIKAVALNNGCYSDTAKAIIQVEPSISIPTLNCTNISQSEITFVWDRVTTSGFEILINGNSLGITNQTHYTQTGLSSGDIVTIKVNAISNTLCSGKSSTLTCQTNSCPPLEFKFEKDTLFACQTSLTDKIKLTVEIDNILNPQGLSWYSTCPACIDHSDNTFDLSQADVGEYRLYVSYDNGLCTYMDSILLIIKLKPKIGLQIPDDTICVTETLPVTIFGTVSTEINFNWIDGSEYIQNMDGNTAYFKWPSDGSYKIRITSILDGCVSDEAVKDIIVEPEMEQLIIQCAESLHNIQITWNSDPCAEQYIILIDNVPVSAQNTNLYLIENLQTGRSVDIQIQAISKCICPGVSSTVTTCSTKDCPEINITFPNDTILFCLNENPQNLKLTANISDNIQNGELIWQGPGIIQKDIFSPVAAGEGDHVITAIYSTGSCNYFSTFSTRVISVLPPILITEDTVCISQNLIISASSSTPGSSVDFVVGKSNIIEFPGNNMFVFKWNSPGANTIAVIANKMGCNSDISSKMILVEPELSPITLKCHPATTSITFDWLDQDCVREYLVTIDGKPQPEQTSNSLVLENLVPNQKVNVKILASSSCACPDIFEQLTCSTKDCPITAVNIIGPTNSYIGDEITLTVNNNNWSGITVDSIIWKSDNEVLCSGICESYSFKVKDNITSYEVILFYNGSCTSTQNHVITPTRLTNVTVPNIINIHSQSNNNKFKIFTDDLSLLVSNLNIFDRWGNLVFNAKNFNPNQTEIFWNGKSGDKELESGVYVYIIEYESPLTGKKVIKGDVTLIK